ncbi:hypothetical protein [Massilia sp. PWRC2]|uniref:hypothetical protein n=1 Tax=Massilia sp. PWRC2 TaxID=2804626 RepID=UPI003CF4B65D
MRKAFVDRLAAGQLRIANTGAIDAVSADGQWHAHGDGDGRTVLDAPVAALMALATRYQIAPGLHA